MSNPNLQSQRVDLLSTKVINFGGRQIKNAGNGTDTQDYITLGQLNSAIAPLATTAALNSVVSNLGLPTAAIQGSVIWAGRPTAGSSLSFQADSNLFYDNTTQTLNVPNFLATTAINLSTLTASEPVLSDSSKNLISGQIDLSSASYVKNQLKVANGGTGLATLTAGSVLVGNGTGNVSLLAGVTGSLSLSLSTGSPTTGTANFVNGFGTTTIQYKDWTGTNQSVTVFTSYTTGTAIASVTGTFLTNVTITSNSFTNGVRTT